MVIVKYVSILLDLTVLWLEASRQLLQQFYLLCVPLSDMLDAALSDWSTGQWEQRSYPICTTDTQGKMAEEKDVFHSQGNADHSRSFVLGQLMCCRGLALSWLAWSKTFEGEQWATSCAACSQQSMRWVWEHALIASVSSSGLLCLLYFGIIMG